MAVNTEAAIVCLCSKYSNVVYILDSVTHGSYMLTFALCSFERQLCGFVPLRTTFP